MKSLREIMDYRPTIEKGVGTEMSLKEMLELCFCNCQPDLVEKYIKALEDKFFKAK